MTTFYCQYIKNKPKIRMGNFISIIITRLLDYPLKITRPCAYLPEVPDQGHTETDADKKIKSNYDKLVDQFNEKLLENRMENRTRDGKSWEERNLLINFPDWNESTISYLHSLFLTFYNEKKMIDFKAFSCILLCLWSGNDKEKRRNQFKKSDINQDGFIDYLEFLDLIYSDRNLAAVSKKIAEQTQFINGLSIGEQLEYGLF